MGSPDHRFQGLTGEEGKKVSGATGGRKEIVETLGHAEKSITQPFFANPKSHSGKTI
jgi:hypothetical protein